MFLAVAVSMGTVPTNQPDWEQIGQRVIQRRTDLGLTQQEAAAKAGVGSTTWLLLEKGRQQRFRPLTLTAIARTLEWPTDAFQRLMRGEDPDAPPAASSGPEGRPAASGKLERLSAEDRAYVEALIDRLLADER